MCVGVKSWRSMDSGAWIRSFTLKTTSPIALKLHERTHVRTHRTLQYVTRPQCPCSLPHRVRVVADVDDQQPDELGKLRADHERAQEDGPFDVHEVLRPRERGLRHSDAGWPRRQPPARTSTNWAMELRSPARRGGAPALPQEGARSVLVAHPRRRGRPGPTRTYSEWWRIVLAAECDTQTGKAVRSPNGLS